MHSCTFKTAAAATLTLTALLALGACSKKVDENLTPAPVTTPSTSMPDPSTSTGNSAMIPGIRPESSTARGSGSTLGSGMTPPAMPASGSR